MDLLISYRAIESKTSHKHKEKKDHNHKDIKKDVKIEKEGEKMKERKR